MNTIRIYANTGPLIRQLRTLTQLSRRMPAAHAERLTQDIERVLQRGITVQSSQLRDAVRIEIGARGLKPLIARARKHLQTHTSPRVRSRRGRR